MAINRTRAYANESGWSVAGKSDAGFDLDIDLLT